VPLARGTPLGAYEIVALLGAGAMGEVYRAREARLGRDVAIKIIQPDLSGHAPGGRSPGSRLESDERYARFEREARALASLNHPNIAHVYGMLEASVGDGDSVVALVMELVEGSTLAEAIPPSGLPPAQVLDIAIELADALVAAQARGVVHRDLKPSNIMVGADGHVKVLDFGLAKLRPWPGDADADTWTGVETVAGKLVGTPAYMSPEQAEGRPVDGRSDLFSLGVVLYEAATGTRPFTGSSPLAILSAIVRDTPTPVTDRKPEIPPALGSTIERLLEKDPSRRHQTAEALRAVLEHIRSGEVQPARARRPRLPRSLIWIAAGAAAVAVVALAVPWLTRREPPAAVATVMQVSSEPGTETHPSLSPDGNWVAYAASGEIYLRRVGTEGDPVHLTEDLSLEAAEPAFSPDGRLIAFSARREGTDLRGGIWLMEVMGAAKRRLTDVGFSPAWSPDGREIAYATEFPTTPYDRARFSRLSIVDVASGQVREIGERDLMEPAWSPSGQRLAYWGVRGTAQRDILTLPAAGGEATLVTDDPFVDWAPVWSHDGRHLYFISDRGGSANVWRVRIDEETGRVLGEPQPVTTPAQVVMRLSFAADDSRFAYEASELQANIERIAFDPDAEAVRGDPVPVTTGARVWWDVDVSVDGRLVFRSALRQEDIYVSNGDGSNITPLAPDENGDRFPRWSPDGTRIAFTSTKGGEGYEIHVIRPDGSGLRRVTFFKPTAAHFPLWSPDGQRLAFTEFITAGGKTYVIDPDGAWTEPLVPVLTPPGPLDLRYRPWSWSPDGLRIVAYSERGAGMIVYDLATGAHEEISAVGAKPRWLRDSRRLIYTDDGALCVIDTQTKQSHEIYRPSAGVLMDPSVSRDNRLIYYIHRRDEGDVWLATMR